MLFLIGAHNIAGNKFAKEGEHAVVSKDLQEIFPIHYFNIP